MSFITIDQAKCNKKGICVAECPTRVIRMDFKDGYPRPTPDFYDFCLKCGHCVAVCPTEALSLHWLRPEDCKPIKSELVVTPEQVEQLLSGRRSIRSFKGKLVPRAILEKLLEIASFAPSVKNQQPWHWIVVQNPKEVRRLAGMVIDWMHTVIQNNLEEAEFMGFTRVAAHWDEGYEYICRGAPHLIVVHASSNLRSGAEDCALALSLFDLYATSFGIGTCWGGYFCRATNAYTALSEALGIPSDHLAFGTMMIGYPKFQYQRIPIRNRPVVTWK